MRGFCRKPMKKVEVFSMLDMIFSRLYTATETISMTAFLVGMAVSLVLGLVLALTYMFRSQYTRSFTVTLAMLPAVVSIVIMMVNGSLGAGVAVAGAFSLVRFRSVPGTAKEIGAIFLSMAVGLACGMGYPGFAALFTLIMCGVNLLYSAVGLGDKKTDICRKTLQITIPEDVDYGGVFEDVFARYTREARLMRVKTANLGSLIRLTYEIVLKNSEEEKAMIDALRCRNGNLEISCSVQESDTAEL